MEATITNKYGDKHFEVLARPEIGVVNVHAEDKKGNVGAYLDRANATRLRDQLTAAIELLPEPKATLFTKLEKHLRGRHYPHGMAVGTVGYDVLEIVRAHEKEVAR